MKYTLMIWMFLAYSMRIELLFVAIRICLIILSQEAATFLSTAIEKVSWYWQIGKNLFHDIAKLSNWTISFLTFESSLIDHNRTTIEML